MRNDDNRATIERFWEAVDGRDWEAVRALIDADAVYELPQSRERFRGRDNFVAINEHYPGDWRVRLVRLTADATSAASEIAFDLGGLTQTGLTFFELRGGVIVRAVEWWPEPFEAQAWRARWAERY